MWKKQNLTSATKKTQIKSAVRLPWAHTNGQKDKPERAASGEDMNVYHFLVLLGIQ